MGKLMKYDILKSKTSLIIFAMTTAVIEVMFLLGYITKSDRIINPSILFFVLLGIGGAFFLLFYAISLYSMDVYKKQGYMTFLTPRNAYQIIGSKLVISFIVLLVGFAVYIGLAALNIQLYANTTESLLAVLIKSIPAEAVPYLVLGLFCLILEWFALITTIYFSVTLTATYLSNVRGKGFIAGLIFIAIDIAIGCITISIFSGYPVDELVTMDNYGNILWIAQDGFTMLFVWAIIINLVITAVFYVATSYIVDKKLSM